MMEHLDVRVIRKPQLKGWNGGVRVRTIPRMLGMVNMCQKNRREPSHHRRHVIAVSWLRNRQDLRILVRRSERDTPRRGLSTHPDECKNEDGGIGESSDAERLASRQRRPCSNARSLRTTSSDVIAGSSMPRCPGTCVTNLPRQVSPVALRRAGSERV